MRDAKGEERGGGWEEVKLENAARLERQPSEGGRFFVLEGAHILFGQANTHWRCFNF